METKQATMAEFLALAGITMKAVRAPGNPNMPDANAGMSHWRCTFTRKTAARDTVDTYTPPLKFTLATYFSQGSAHTKPPEAADVLDCLASDASNIGDSFDDWCEDMGYNNDSRRAFKTWEACRKNARELKAFLWDDLYARLLFDTERL